MSKSRSKASSQTRQGSSPRQAPAAQTQSPSAVRSPGYGKSERWILLLLALVTLVGLYRAVDRPFTWWDDQQTIHQNPAMNPPDLKGLGVIWTQEQAGLYIPVTYTAWWLLAKVAYLGSPDDFGISLNSWIYHGYNVTLHLISVMIVYQLLRRLKINPWPAAFGAAVFAVHPVQVESVCWASGAKDLMWGMFALASVYCWMRSAQADRQATLDSQAPAGSESPVVGHKISNPHLESTDSLPIDTPLHARRFYIASLVLMLLGTFSKPTAIVTPLICFSLDYFIVGRSFRRICQQIWPMAIIALPAVIITKLVQVTLVIDSQDRLYSPLWARPFILTDSLAFYLYKLIAPVNLCIDYGRSPLIIFRGGSFWWSWTIPAAVAAVAWFKRRQWPWLPAACVIFPAAMLPVLGLVPFMYAFASVVADHYLYVALFAVAIVAAMGLQLLYRWAGARLIAVFVVSILALLSWRQCGFWQTDHDVMEHAIVVNPKSFTGYNNLAGGLLNDIHSDKGLLAQADLPLSPTDQYRLQRKVLFNSYLSMQYFQGALNVYPEYQWARVMLSIRYAELGQIDQAIYHLRFVADLAGRYPQYAPPQLPEALNMIGVRLARMHRYPDAEDFLKRSLRARDAFEPATINLQRLSAYASAHPASETQPITFGAAAKPDPNEKHLPGEDPAVYLPVNP